MGIESVPGEPQLTSTPNTVGRPPERPNCRATLQGRRVLNQEEKLSVLRDRGWVPGKTPEDEMEGSGI